MAAVNLRRAPVRDLMPLGTKDWVDSGAGYLPDSIASYEVRGVTYLVTANEGEAREWGDYVDSERLAHSRFPLCADVFPDAGVLAEEALGRLIVSEEDGIRNSGSEACRQEIVTLGGLSFSIWTTDGERVLDSRSRLESLLTAGAGGTDPAVALNATNDDNDSFADATTPTAGDLGPEGLALVARQDSPVRRPLLAVGNEVSGTTTVHAVSRGR